MRVSAINSGCQPLKNFEGNKRKSSVFQGFIRTESPESNLSQKYDMACKLLACQAQYIAQIEKTSYKKH